MNRWILVAALLVGCGGKEADSASAGGAAGTPYINILAPTPGEFIDEGQEVLLSAEGRTGSGALTSISDVLWTSEDEIFEASGNDVSVTNLHPGAYELWVEGSVEGQTVMAAVEVVVYAQR